MLARPSTIRMAFELFEQEGVSLHRPVDTLSTWHSPGLVGNASLAPEQSRDAPIAIGRSLFGQVADGAGQLARGLLRATPRSFTITTIDQGRAREAKGGGHTLHRVSRGSGECDNNVGFALPRQIECLFQERYDPVLPGITAESSYL